MSPPRSASAPIVLVTLALGASVPTATSGQSAMELAPHAEVSVSLDAPSDVVRVGEPLEIVARVVLRGGARGPWMVAPTSDGPALEVVRGRLFSVDASRGDADVAEGPAILRIPVFPRAAGTTVLRARVRAYACEARRCRPIDGEGALVIEVEAS